MVPSRLFTYIHTRTMVACSVGAKASFMAKAMAPWLCCGG